MKIVKCMEKMSQRRSRTTPRFLVNNALTIKLLLMTTLVQSISSEYGPSILSLVQPFQLSTTLPFFATSNDGRHFESRILRLEDFPNYATVLPLAEGRPWSKSEDIIEILGKESLNRAVSVVVIPPPGYGMMVVIQELQIPAHTTFNRSLLVIDENGMILECFSQFVFQIEGKFPVKVCGRTNDQEGFRPSVLDGVGPRSFVVPIGRSITVRFIFRDEQIDHSEALLKQVPFYDMGYLFRASIAFTSYKSCPHGPPYVDEMHGKQWPCDIPQSNREPVAACVPEEVFCDSVINCGIHDTHEFGIDERFCKEWKDDGDPSFNLSHRHRPSTLDSTLLKEAIHSRIINGDRPFNYNDMTQVHGGHSSRPRPRPDTGSDFTFPPTEPTDIDVSHPAFVTLVILISIICVLITGLLFRFCCKRCMGKQDPFAESSNPEALARFHGNLRTRDHEGIGRPASGYGLSSDSLFKPASDDFPPSYDDLFPHEIPNDKIRTLENSQFNPPQLQSTSSSPLPPYNSNSSSNIMMVRGGTPAVSYDNPVPTSIYTIPVIQQQSSGPVGENEQNFPSPLSVHVEVLSGSVSNQAEVRDAGGGGGGIVTVISNRRGSAPTNNQTHDYPDHHHNRV